jgi:hypothetical protein
MRVCSLRCRLNWECARLGDLRQALLNLVHGGEHVTFPPMSTPEALPLLSDSDDPGGAAPGCAQPAVAISAASINAATQTLILMRPACVLYASAAPLRFNNRKRPGNTGVNTDGRTLGNFEAGSARLEILWDDSWGISWRGHEI